MINKRLLTPEIVEVAENGNLEGRTDSLLKTTQNSAKRTNHIQARIEKIGETGEKMNHKISEYSKLVKKNIKRLDTTGWAK